MVKARLKFAGLSDMGRVRTNNEDAWHIDADRGIFLVVDGIGGQAAGEKAAEIAVERVRARLERQTGTTEQRIREAIAMANNEIFRAARENPDWDGMACVLTLAVLDNGSAVIGHVGDSRLYLIRPGSIRKITHDHSPVGEREDAGEISENDAMRHPRRNEVYRDVGSEEHTPDDPDFIEIQRIPFDPDTALLLCSDGLSDLVPSSRIRETIELHAGDPETAARELIDAANRAGGKDNVTVVIVEGEQFTAPSTEAPRHSRRNWLLPLLILLALGALAAGNYLWWRNHQPRQVTVLAAPDTWTVPPGGSISEALSKARAGDTVALSAGEYREPVNLKSGVFLVARPPRQAVLRQAITADHVQGARISGLLVQPETSIPAAIVLTDSSVEIDNTEITGAEIGIVIRGSGESSIGGNLIHDCGAVGILISGPATPWISHNVIARNKKAGLAAAEGAKPVLTGNTFDHNKLDLPEPEMKTVREHNYFEPHAVPPHTAGGRK